MVTNHLIQMTTTGILTVGTNSYVRVLLPRPLSSGRLGRVSFLALLVWLRGVFTFFRHISSRRISPAVEPPLVSTPFASLRLGTVLYTVQVRYYRHCLDQPSGASPSGSRCLLVSRFDPSRTSFFSSSAMPRPRDGQGSLTTLIPLADTPMRIHTPPHNGFTRFNDLCRLDISEVKGRRCWTQSRVFCFPAFCSHLSKFISAYVLNVDPCIHREGGGQGKYNV